MRVGDGLGDNAIDGPGGNEGNGSGGNVSDGSGSNASDGERLIKLACRSPPAVWLGS